MAIVQISKITQRSGNIVDLPQLDNAELGWATDARQLFIGNDNNITGVENVEVLTSYSTIDFDQLNGSAGNLNIDSANLANGQVMTYDGVNWTNRGGNVGGLINLGELSNLKIDGGAIGYVLQTDGTGNLSWAPKTTITAFIQNASQVNSPNTTVTNTTVTTNIITVGNSTNFPANTAVYFTSSLGGLVANSTYYIRNNISTTQVTVATSLGGGNVALSTASGSLTMRKVELVLTSTENNDFVEGQQITITNVPVMTQLNGNSFYANVLSSNTFSLYTDASLTIPVNAVTYGTFPYTSVTATSSTSDQITVGDATPFTINDPVVFVGNTDQSNSNIIAGQTYYVLTKDTAAPNTWMTLSETVGGSTLQLGNSTITANIFTSGGRAIATISGSGTGGAAGGSNTSVQYNNSGISTGDSDFTWSYTGAKVLTVNGNANVGNLNSTSTVNANVIISRITTGTAPLAVTSTTRVANLNVNYANVSDFGVVTAQTTGTFFPVFVSGSTSGNYALAANSNISFNAATGNLSVTLINSSGNANVGNLGTSGLVLATGNITGGNLNTGGVVSATGNITGGNLNSSGTVTASRLISNVATGTAPLTVTSTTRVANLNVNYANVSDFGAVTAQTTGTFFPVFVSGSTSGNYALSANSNISFNAATGNLSVSLLNATSNANVGNLGTSGLIIATGNITGGNLNTGGAANVTGNITGGNLRSSNYIFRSTNNGITATGSNQAGATQLNTEFNRITTGGIGSGVRLPGGAAGMSITIMNATGNAMLVYPFSGGAVNSLATDVGYSQPPSSTLQYISVSTTQWYTVGASYA